MALTKSFTHQEVRAVVVNVLGANMGAALANNPLFDLPAGAIPVGGHVRIVSPFDAAETFDIGDVDDPNRFTATPIDADATAGTHTALDASSFPYAQRRTIGITPSAQFTQGEAQITFLYINSNVGGVVEG